MFNFREQKSERSPLCQGTQPSDPDLFSFNERRLDRVQDFHAFLTVAGQLLTKTCSFLSRKFPVAGMGETVIIGETTIDFTSWVKSSARGEHLIVSGPLILL
jgi:hypothetical protein